jgi:hypothetical protein
MKQHNHWKLSKLQKAIIKISLWGVGVVLLLLDAILKKTLDFNFLSSVVGALSILFGLFLTLLERVLWRTKIMALPFLENYWTPVLAGRWEGTLIRNKESHRFVIEIKQNFTTISCITYSSHSCSSALATEILYDEQLGTYELLFYWNGQTSTVQEPGRDLDSFNGLTVLNVKLDRKRAVGLSGYYFTNRQPIQTRGKIDLIFRQKDLKNCF